VARIFCSYTPSCGNFIAFVYWSANASLKWFLKGLYYVRISAVFTNTMILGRNLSASQAKDDTLKHNPATLYLCTMLRFVAEKTYLMPIIGVLSAAILKLYSLDTPEDTDDSLYLVLQLMIVFLTPSAKHVMVNLSSSGTKEGFASVIALQDAGAPLICQSHHDHCNWDWQCLFLPGRHRRPPLHLGKEQILMWHLGSVAAACPPQDPALGKGLQQLAILSQMVHACADLHRQGPSPGRSQLWCDIPM
jgi:hypothetical protein